MLTLVVWWETSCLVISHWLCSTKWPQFGLTGSRTYQRDNNYRATTWTGSSPRCNGIRYLCNKWVGLSALWGWAEVLLLCSLVCQLGVGGHNWLALKMVLSWKEIYIKSAVSPSVQGEFVDSLHKFTTIITDNPLQGFDLRPVSVLCNAAYQTNWLFDPTFCWTSGFKTEKKKYVHVPCMNKRNSHKNVSKCAHLLLCSLGKHVGRMWCILKYRKVGFCLFKLSKELWLTHTWTEHTFFGSIFGIVFWMVGKIIFPQLLM